MQYLVRRSFDIISQFISCIAYLVLRLLAARHIPTHCRLSISPVYLENTAKPTPAPSVPPIGSCGPPPKGAEQPHTAEPEQESHWIKSNAQWQADAVVLDTSDNVSVMAGSAVLQRFC